MKIVSEKYVTEKQGYEAMLYMLQYYYDLTESNDLTDILSGGEYMDEDTPADSAFWEYWLDAVEKVKQDGPPPLKVLVKKHTFLREYLVATKQAHIAVDTSKSYFQQA